MNDSTNAITLIGAPAALPAQAAQDERLVTIDDAMQRLNVCRATVYNLIRSGKLRSIKIGRARRIPLSAVLAIMDDTSSTWAERAAEDAVLEKVRAAAPLLLEALQQCLSVLHNIDSIDMHWAGAAGEGLAHQHAAIDAARVAIAAATN